MDLMLIIFFISVLVIVSGSIYTKLLSHSITEPFLALLLGVLVGPDVLDIIHSAEPPKEFHILKTTCEITLAMALMAAAMRLPNGFFKKNSQTSSILVIGGMVFMWLLSGAVLFWLLPLLMGNVCSLVL